MQRLMRNGDKGTNDATPPEPTAAPIPPLRNPHARIVGWIRETVSLSDAPVTLDKRCATERDNKTAEKKRARLKGGREGGRGAAAEINPVMGRVRLLASLSKFTRRRLYHLDILRLFRGLALVPIHPSILHLLASSSRHSSSSD